MSREKMLQAEIALKDEQLADLTKEVERLRRQSEESGKRAKTADASESKIAELKQTIGKLAPAAKKTVQCAAELEKTRRRLAVVEKEQNELSKSYSALSGQAATLKNALDKSQKNVCTLDGERKETAERAKVAEATTKATARKNLTVIFITALLCVGTVCGSYAYVKAALRRPPNCRRKRRSVQAIRAGISSRRRARDAKRTRCLKRRTDAPRRRTKSLRGIERKHRLGQNHFLRLAGVDFRRRICGWSNDDFCGIRLLDALTIKFSLFEIIRLREQFFRRPARRLSV